MTNPTEPVWKNVYFAIGLVWLIYGALHFDYPDWDIRLSLLMAGSTYLTADRFVDAIRKKDPRGVLRWLPGVWWSIDGSYWLYWSLVDPSVMIRAYQWPMSTCLYLLCGILWTSAPGTPPTALLRHPPGPDPSDPEKGPSERP